MDGEGRLELRGECLWAAGRGADARVFAALCRALAVACMESDIKRVLIDATGCDPDGATAVRDAFTVMVLAGMPDGFRAALVTNVPKAQGLFVAVQRTSRCCASRRTFSTRWMQPPSGSPARGRRVRQRKRYRRTRCARPFGCG